MILGRTRKVDEEQTSSAGKVELVVRSFGTFGDALDPFFAFTKIGDGLGIYFFSRLLFGKSWWSIE